MLELKGISKRYAGEKTFALNRVDLRIMPGEFVAVLGRSGAGKSSLIRCINRLEEPDAGEVVWNGQSITGMNARELRSIRGEIGMVFQHFNLLPRMSVLTNVIAGSFAVMPRWRSLIGAFTREDRTRALSALREVGLEELAKRRVEDLSGGQKQRVAIARVLMQQPTLLLGDEPISSLDAVTAKRVMTYIAGLHIERGITIVLNLHDVAMARAYATRIVGITAGCITFDDTPEQLGEDELRLIYPPDEEDGINILNLERNEVHVSREYN
ncbi:phosphonate ABC transporter ATP-binding protein [Paenibacillus prosopidis]|uniref:Phosphonate transport system ATP-binding protein n=1 Tax=Paenibacillus prosopidis TaxID=630520 RepID=A0A368W957_9BACL|nr:phosphonate ABC transporter ATP-binding protein [Paenibacillus prosopidis]RCW51893.1 phosphonate transport system ATP-binding protein [Paenibacillus prosopidis]